MSLNAKTTKLASITQNNHVYEHTAEGPTPKVSLNVRSPYRRQKRDLSIIRSLFRRPLYTGIEILAINIITFLPTTSTTSYFLPSYLLAIISTTSYLPAFLRPHRLPTTDIHIVDLSKTTHTRSANQNRAKFAMPRHDKSSS
jgi:hypothetical protein